MKRTKFFAALIVLLALCPKEMLHGQTTGPAAPEYTTFEPIDATDMVNLLTGDFSYTLPLISIPGPEGGFPLALFYHAGITIEQESSWVGLGWNINPGAINRVKRGFPDDWRKADFDVTYYNEGAEYSEYSFEIGFGTKTNLGISASVTWDSNKSFNGSVGIGYKGASFGIGTSGMHWGIGIGGIISPVTEGVEPEKYNYLNASIGINMGLNGHSIAGGIEVGYNDNSSLSMGSLGFGLSTEGFSGGFSVMGNGPSQTRDLAVASDITVSGFSINIPYMIPNTPVSGSLGYSKYKWHVWNSEAYDVYGSLYLTEASDIPHDIQLPYIMMDTYDNPADNNDEDDLIDRARSNLSILPNYDQYIVNSQGLNGTFSPYIFQNGTLTMQQALLSFFESTGYRKEAVQYYFGEENKGFNRFNKNPHDIYFYFDYENSSFLEISEGALSIGGDGIPLDVVNYDNGSTITENQNGESFYNAALQRKGSGKFIQWFTNNEIHTNIEMLRSQGFVEYDGISQGDRGGEQYPQDGIGAFCITTEDGKTYHYTLPVYHFEEFVVYEKKSDPSAEYQETRYLDKYAYNWLLTAITGPDYVDNGNGYIDDEDWGYWVKFDYGKWSDGFVWRTPYQDETYAETNSEDEFGSYSFGRKEIYYLNSISTKTHTAYFIKSLRNDGMGKQLAYTPDNHYNAKKVIKAGGLNENCECLDNLIDGTYILRGTDHVNINCSMSNRLLKLDHIILAKNDQLHLNPDNNHLNPLIEMGTGTINVTQNKDVYNTIGQWYGKCPGTVYTNTFNFHLQENVLDINDIDDWDMVNSKALKVISFNYNYDLCRSIPNSSSLGEGKLTLESVDFAGLNGKNIIPPYLFDYYKLDLLNNYNLERKDAWGFDAGSESDKMDNINKLSAHNWSLKSITTPLGGTIHVEYESDSYSREALAKYTEGLGTKEIVFDRITKLADHTYRIRIPGTININDYFYVGTVNYDVQLNDFSSTHYGTFAVDCQNSAYVSSIEGNSLTIETSYWGCGNNSDDFSSMAIGEEYYTHSYIIGKLHKGDGYFYESLYGGGIRVKSIMLESETDVYRTVYNYSNPETSQTSGITSYAPEDFMIFHGDRYIPYINEVPPPGVQYEYVTVRNEGNNTEDKIETVYHFDVIKPSVFSNIGSFFSVSDETSSTLHSVGSTDYYTITKSVEMMDNFSAIGRILETKTVNTMDHSLINTTNYVYKDPNILNQGITEETFHSIKHYYKIKDEDNATIYNAHRWYLFNSTTRKRVPNVLEKVITNNNGFISEVNYVDDDFYTGQTTYTTSKYPSGKTVGSHHIRAYSIDLYKGAEVNDPSNIGMGSKLFNVHNKNMLTQEAASYLYKLDANNEIEGTLSASIQTWNNEWPYRNYNEGTRRFSDSRETDVWRKHKTFAWKGELNDDGTYTNFTDFDWNLADLDQNAGAGWQKAGEIMRYNHYSSPLESKDINGHFAAGKMDPNETLVEAAAVNANYRCFASTGFEKVLGDRHGGEFVDSDHTSERMVSADHEDAIIGTNAIAGINAHTGKYYLRIDRGNSPKFLSIYDGLYPDMGLQPGKYRASVWVHKNSSDFTTLRVQFNSTSTGVYSTVSKPDKTFTAGDWELLYLDFEVLEAVANSYFRAYVYTGDVAYIDDLRIAPLTSQVTAYVYDEDTDQLTYMLNNNNFAVKYEYDAAGRLIAVYKETENGFEKTNEYAYGYAHRDIVIKRHPYSTIYPLRVCTAESATLYVEAENATNYQWQVSSNGGASYTNVGSNSAQYTARHYSSGSYRYRCIVSNPASSVTSYTITMVVLPSQPVITSQPVDAAYCTGYADFELTAEGVTSYQWYRKRFVPPGPSSFEPIPGATGPKITVNSIVTDPVGTQYYCEVGSECGASVNSNTVTLLASEAPDMPGAISGPTDVPPGILVHYYVYDQPGCTYQWNVPMYGTIQGDPNGAAIDVRFDYLPGGGEQLELGDITVQAVNECGVASVASSKTLFTAIP